MARIPTPTMPERLPLREVEGLDVASAAESRRLRLHLLICGLCRRLPAQFTGLRECVRHACRHETASEEHSDAILPEESKRRIADRLPHSSGDS